MLTTALILLPFASFDALVVSTNHKEFKDPALYEGVGLVVDSRNLIDPLRAAGARGPRRLVKA